MDWTISIFLWFLGGLAEIITKGWPVFLLIIVFDLLGVFDFLEELFAKLTK